jgi:glycosyltransferase involved in cell wall biosynthesis
MKLAMYPMDWGSGESGVKRVVEAYRRYLPQYGVQLVGKDDAPDLVAAHISADVDVDVLHCHGLYWTGDHDLSRHEWHVNSVVIEGLRHASLITVPSEWVAESIRRDFRVNPTVIPHGIEFDQFEPGENRGYVLWNKNRPSDACDPAPMNRLALALPSVKFVSTFGDVRSNIQLIGIQPHEKMREFIASAGVYLATTKETFGIGTLEAMACFPAETNVQAKNVMRAMERLYTGTMVTIETGRATIRVTGEHPFWTTEGWVPAKSLTKKHLLCYIGKYACSQDIHTGTIAEVVGALRDPYSRGDWCSMGEVEASDWRCLARLGGQQNPWRDFDPASGLPNARAIGVYSRDRGWRGNGYDQAFCQEVETDGGNCQHVNGSDGLVADGTARTGETHCDHPNSQAGILLHVSRYGSDQFAVSEGRAPVSGYQASAHGITGGMDRVALAAIQERPALAAPPRNYGATEGFEYQTIRSISYNEVTDLPVYNFTTASSTYLAEGYLVHNCGVPVLGYAYGGILDMVTHLEHGYLAKPGNDNDLVDGLMYCMQNRDRLGTAARERAREFRWEPAIEKLVGVYEQALKLRQRPAAVTIVIPSYKHAGEVGRAVKSCLSQTLMPKHVIVIDDGSPDDGATEKAVEEAAAGDLRVDYVSQENRGVAIARNVGLAMSTTKYVCCLDADDAISDRFLEVCVAALEKDRSLGIAYTGLWAVKPDGEEGLSAWPGQFDFEQQLKGDNQVPTCCVFRREIFERLGGYRQRYAPDGCGTEDAEFWLRAGALGFRAAKVTEEPLFIYSYLSGAASGGQARSVEWRTWHPWAFGLADHPVASLAKPRGDQWSHPVHQHDRPAVSVVIPVGPGHERVVIDALDSVEAQTYQNWEVVLVNDTGHDLGLATAYPYLRITNTEGKVGAGRARNLGIAAARAPLFACLDADDILQTQFLQMLLTEYEKEGGWVYADSYILHGKGQSVEEYPAYDFDVRQLCESGIAGVTALYAKADWVRVGGFSETSGREDWDFHLRLAKAGICGNRVPHLLWSYRHTTGKRRDAEGLKAEVERLRQEFPVEELLKMCGACNQKNKRRAERTMANAGVRSLDPGETVMIEYLGKNKTDVPYIGSAGGVYRFGANDNSRVLAVKAADAPNFLGRWVGLFRLAGQLVTETT